MEAIAMDALVAVRRPVPPPTRKGRRRALSLPPAVRARRAPDPPRRGRRQEGEDHDPAGPDRRRRLRGGRQYRRAGAAPERLGPPGPAPDPTRAAPLSRCLT